MSNSIMPINTRLWYDYGFETRRLLENAAERFGGAMATTEGNVSPKRETRNLRSAQTRTAEFEGLESGRQPDESLFLDLSTLSPEATRFLENDRRSGKRADSRRPASGKTGPAEGNAAAWGKVAVFASQSRCRCCGGISVGNGRFFAIGPGDHVPARHPCR